MYLFSLTFVPISEMLGLACMHLLNGNSFKIWDYDFHP